MHPIKALAWRLIRIVPQLRPVHDTRWTQTPIPLGQQLKYLFSRHRLPYWPMHPSSVAVDTHRVHIGIETSPGLMPGCYIQGTNGIFIGDYTQIAAGVKIISANHSLVDNRAHSNERSVHIGAYCWLGANSIILPGVTLGSYTIVGAGAVVTRSFPEGYCVVAGNPAKIIRHLDPLQCVDHQSNYRYHGFIRADQFAAFQDKHLVPLSHD